MYYDVETQTFCVELVKEFVDALLVLAENDDANPVEWLQDRIHHAIHHELCCLEEAFEDAIRPPDNLYRSLVHANGSYITVKSAQALLTRFEQGDGSLALRWGNCD